MLGAAVLPFLGAWQFFRARSGAHPRHWATLFVLLFYCAVALQGSVR
ncbi:hypothetical protein HMPREF9336_04341 [Segniliparus rugosus ATCC BAA-974]|uniref:Uncharacterized protein n=1 Tax=Segniliparus rugosus (strain ATCC BAA-974 / DSM 45345 / CCUG 50838 / CIP 108380 / JCM 13579 / CDC 945) TaxID=679197 RepID=U1M1D5_SEGRC|nr:hypothetical protein HMPREF9336_04341 [Segniliparus rugosus ATCC BAA-974]